MKFAPERGRIIRVNFEMGGAPVPPEMPKGFRPCIVVQNNKLQRGRLVTVVPLSTREPDNIQPFHHEMDHRSFMNWPFDDGGQALERWAKCDYVTTVSLDRCKDPYKREQFGNRRFLKVKAIKADIDAIDRCVLWALGIDPDNLAT